MDLTILQRLPQDHASWGSLLERRRIPTSLVLYHEPRPQGLMLSRKLWHVSFDLDERTVSNLTVGNARPLEKDISGQAKRKGEQTCRTGATTDVLVSARFAYVHWVS